jgi:hypothetical protein
VYRHVALYIVLRVLVAKYRKWPFQHLAEQNPLTDQSKICKTDYVDETTEQAEVWLGVAAPHKGEVVD